MEATVSRHLEPSSPVFKYKPQTLIMDKVLNISKAVWSQILPWRHVVKITWHGYEKQVGSCSSLESMETNEEEANVTYSVMDISLFIKASAFLRSVWSSCHHCIARAGRSNGKIKRIHPSTLDSCPNAQLQLSV